MSAREKPRSLSVGSYYSVVSRKLFGPNDVVPAQENVVELLPGKILQCKALHANKNGWLGRGCYVSLELCDEEFAVLDKVSHRFTTPSWIKPVSALELLADASGE